ncbi:hypothetical protein, partial [Pseudomonas chlororaphis]|uniref:hypothetical protein n=1 Tax=Pseudomonas chlororaphis TaxID=587753 RepID=UPI001B33E32B
FCHWPGVRGRRRHEQKNDLSRLMACEGCSERGLRSPVLLIPSAGFVVILSFSEKLQAGY